jgi:ubiquitin carboxyl-terminal hydrolase L5
LLYDVHADQLDSELDVMNVDTRLKEDSVETAKKQKRAEEAKMRKGKKRQKRASFDREDEESGFHFIAYVPAGGTIWRMDGMETFPRQIGKSPDLETLRETNRP